MTNTNKENNNDASRRDFALKAGLAGMVLAANRASAQTTPVPAGDIAILNYALTLEHLEANFYVTGLSRYSANDFNNSAVARSLGAGTVAGIYTNLGRIRDHEVAHVQTLQTTIRTLGGTPVTACSAYNFGYNTPDDFLRVAGVLEEVGVTAYDGVIAMITTAALKAAGASIATVEARHSSYLNLLNLDIPFPRAFDQTRTMAEVLALAAPFLPGTCSTGGGGGTTPPPAGATTAVLLPRDLTTTSAQITLDASTSTSSTNQPLTYLLRVLSGSAAVFMGTTARPMVQFTGGSGTYTFELTVTDSAGTSATDRVTVRYVSAGE